MNVDSDVLIPNTDQSKSLAYPSVFSRYANECAKSMERSRVKTTRH